MYHSGENFLAATAEWMNLHVDLGTRRVTPWPDFVMRALAELAESHADVPFPREAGRKMNIRKPVWTGQAPHGEG
jgi:acyl-CoA thioester hydrolase